MGIYEWKTAQHNYIEDNIKEVSGNRISVAENKGKLGAIMCAKVARDGSKNQEIRSFQRSSSLTQDLFNKLI